MITDGLRSNWSSIRGRGRGWIPFLAMGVLCLATRTCFALPPDTDFADFLLGSDLVCKGSFVSQQLVTRVPSGGCGNPGGVEMHAWDYRVTVEDVLSGVAEDSVLVVSSLRGLEFPMGALQPGAKVIVYANRVCEDGWRLWGGMVIVTASGYIVPPTAFGKSTYLRGSGGSSPISEMALMGAMSSREGQMSSASFAGASGVALVRLGEVSVDNQTQHYTYQCDSLGWIIPGQARVPGSIRFAIIPGCKPYLAPGDTLLVPVPAGGASENMNVETCPRGWVVHFGFLSGLATPIGFLDYALRSGPNGVTVNKFLVRPSSE